MGAIFILSFQLIIMYTLCLGMILLYFALVPSIKEAITNFKQELTEKVIIEQE